MSDKLETIFDLLCEDFIYLLKEKKLASADRKTLIEFLKENGVSTVGQNNKSVKNIIDNLPFADEEDPNVVSIKKRKE